MNTIHINFTRAEIVDIVSDSFGNMLHTSFDELCAGSAGVEIFKDLVRGNFIEKVNEIFPIFDRIEQRDNEELINIIEEFPIRYFRKLAEEYNGFTIICSLNRVEFSPLSFTEWKPSKIRVYSKNFVA